MAFQGHHVTSGKGRFALPVVIALLAAGCGTAASQSPAPASVAPAATAASAAPASAAASSAPTETATASAAAGAVTVALSQFKVELGATSAPGGSVKFDVTNNGSVEHEFVVFKTDLAADKLPLSSDGKSVDEEGTGVKAIDEIAEFEPGKTESLTVDLPAGRYVLICNVPTHYTKGMHAEFTTTGG
jgi:uncharacterized cupredoxin-like copper-binding protein